MKHNQENILIVGAGQLGSRHLQSLSSLNREFYQITVVDPSHQSLETARERYNEVKNSSSPEATYIDSISKVTRKNVFLAIISTSASVRYKVLKELTESTLISNLILEKVLFQSENQLNLATKIINKNNIKAWVNCPRREYKIYNTINKDCEDSQYVNIKVTGNRWGLACNSIHFIDLWSYLKKFDHYSIKNMDECTTIESKRAGYKELTGSIYAKSPSGNIELNCKNELDQPISLSVTIETDSLDIIIDECTSEILKYQKHGKDKSLVYQPVYQSSLTSKAVIDISHTGDCKLTPYNESQMLHEELLTKTSNLFNKHSRLTDLLSPIT